ncbi:Amino acid/amide ABC transporter substrate-binding protein, HAAT family [Halomicronema hongdechloris C2206]|uniref:Amino acid/amide ABC transporter substrate-binding protein, HAAT family n=1 Tax=Halomicronema hongdechloris C2206 TaxID=1641165 RepID=A0A1Z3HPP0_9CYAN|nr:ABC transporter substrate-binding protein [Halomicronema hongdechloris]ASC72137.1 Amino acid/amide ABC transporter substrate-binding protein, HAAT family [Halomicronema hongdechloris C2206]
MVATHSWHYRWRQFGATVAMTVLVAACGGTQQTTEDTEATTESASRETVDLGALLPMTGDLQAFGETSLNGINMAVDDINADGGVLGKTLAVNVGDTQTAAQPSIDAAQKLISLEGVVAIIGALSSGNTIPVAESITSKNTIPQISSASTSPVITGLNDNDFLFRTVPSDAFQGVALAQIAREQELEQLAVIYINNDYGQGLAESFKAAFEAQGGTITGMVPYEQAQASYRGELQQLAQGDATALTLIGYPENGITILKQALEEGFFDSFVFTDGMKAPEVIDAIGAETLEGAFGTAPQALTDSDAYQTFVSAYEAAYGELPPKPYIDTAYDATMLLALAIQKAGNTDGAAIRDALREVANAPGTKVGPGDWAVAVDALADGEDIDYEGASGALEFDDNGDVGGTFAHWVIQDGEIVTVEVFEPKS